MSRNVMLAYGKGSVKKNGTYDAVMKVLKECGKNVIDLADIPANPTYSKVCEGIKLYKENDVDLILALGDGSVVDCAKIITAIVYTDEDIWQLFFLSTINIYIKMMFKNLHVLHTVSWK